ncbi:MAG: winged helix-turn-helix domain-containing protein [Myxococcales bacterium]|nr:winged helix-turn-helix domain-containing protein [Myxococcales bacterium]
MATASRVADWVAERHAASVTVLETVLRSREDELLPQSSPDGTATQRVAHWILERHESEFEGNLPRTVMADMLGMRPETPSRALKALAAKGLIEVGRRHLLVVDLEGLQATLPA